MKHALTSAEQTLADNVASSKKALSGKLDSLREVKQLIAVMNCTENELAGFIADPSPAVREVVANRGTEQLLDELVDDQSEDVRLAVAKRGFVSHCDKLTADPSLSVKYMASTRLRSLV